MAVCLSACKHWPSVTSVCPVRLVACPVRMCLSSCPPVCFLSIMMLSQRMLVSRAATGKSQYHWLPLVQGKLFQHSQQAQPTTHSTEGLRNTERQEGRQTQRDRTDRHTKTDRHG